MANKKPLNHLRLRQSLYFHLCCVCLKRIEPGESYRDGGYYRRAHMDCADAAEVKPDLEKTRAQQDQTLGRVPWNSRTDGTD